MNTQKGKSKGEGNLRTLHTALYYVKTNENLCAVKGYVFQFRKLIVSYTSITSKSVFEYHYRKTNCVIDRLNM